MMTAVCTNTRWSRGEHSADLLKVDYSIVSAAIQMSSV